MLHVAVTLNEMNDYFCYRKAYTPGLCFWMLAMLHVAVTLNEMNNYFCYRKAYTPINMCTYLETYPIH